MLAEHHQEKKTFAEKLSIFFNSYKKQLIIASIAIIVIIIAVSAYVIIGNMQTQKYLEKVEDVQQQYSEYVSAEEADKVELYDSISDDLDTILNKNKNNYPALRAAYLYGQLEYREENYEEAIKHFTYVYENFSDLYLAPSAKMNAAVVYEKIDDLDSAIEELEGIYESYKDTYQDAGRALFNVGRLYESKGSVNDAIDAYEQLITDSPDSEWSKLANTRIISIEIEENE